MEIYHGSYMPVENPRIIRGRFTKDFGEGFYCTELKKQAEKWAQRYETPIISIYEYVEKEGLDIKRFDGMSDEWLDFIVACRNGTPHNHDIVIGAMADDQIYNYVSDFINGILTREQFWVMAKFKYPTHQINFCTQAALNCIIYKGMEDVRK